MEEDALEHLLQRAGFGEVGVVALGLAGQLHVQRVVHVVGPLRVEARPVELPRGDRERVVAVGLRDQPQRPAQPGRQGVDLSGQLLQQ